VTTANADETTARLIINPIAETARTRSMVMLHKLLEDISTATVNGK
jgi:hypothetical protein